MADDQSYKPSIGEESPESNDIAQIQFANWLFSQNFEFVKGVAALTQLPDSDLPEVAFVGRSNVGKSSLVNALTNQKKLARTSNTPGRTQQINFFYVEDQLMLADLPGYGYAKASKSEVAKWNKLIKQYLQGRPQLVRIYLLIDARHGVKPSDLEMMDLFDKCAVSYQIILTKVDKITPQHQEDAKTSTAQKICKRPAAHPTILVTSAQKGDGIREVKKAISSLAIGR